MKRTAEQLLTIGITVLFLAATAWAAPELAIDPGKCLDCHADRIAADVFAQSVHGQNACTSCHVEITDLEKHRRGEITIRPVRCARCHKQEAADHYASVHMLHEIGCSDCHADIHGVHKWGGDKRQVVAVCTRCHEITRYEYSVHGQGINEGKQDAAACHDCHHLHAIKPLGDPASGEFRSFHTEVCLGCHADREMMERNRVFPLAVKTYWESFHGKSFRLGFPQQVAGCVDCHTAHEVLSADQPASSIHPENLIGTCGRCHRQVTASFTRFYVHGEHTDRQHYPILFWTFVAMTTLIVGVFAVFWVHTLLWLFRGFVENRQREADLAAGRLTPLPDGQKQYRRFRKLHIFLHLLVIVSFLGLSLTGLPLKFSGHSWARAMMSFYGGVEYAGLIHRVCAILTFFYFFVAIGMSLHFLFLRRDARGSWLQRLFGPDSLMPNRKDLRDIEGMVRWFFFRGPKPAFERWTYWEKFDFFAVFWGMFAIGGSGLLLWFPELSCRFLPGWVLNVATIVHSDEALLATGFIFTVHFFNTHGRPEKFPMDFVIFNGEVAKEELIRERAEQWNRYQQLGITEQFRVEKTSGVLFDFIFKGFGFLALLAGLFLAFLEFYAFIKG